MSAAACAGEGTLWQVDPAFSALVQRLLKGVLYRSADESMWASLLRRREELARYVGVLGLTLHVSEEHGFSLLHPIEAYSTPDVHDAYRWVPHATISFSITLLLVQLRKRLAQLDVEGSEERLVFEHAELAELVTPWMVGESIEPPNIDACIDATAALGFLRPLPGDRARPRYEVMRILEAWVGLGWLTALDQRLGEAGGRGAASSTVR